MSKHITSKKIVLQNSNLERLSVLQEVADEVGVDLTLSRLLNATIAEAFKAGLGESILRAAVDSHRAKAASTSR